MNALELKGLRKEYRDFCLEGLDLTLPSGCIMGLVGENGAGKSTTMKLILNMIRADGGSVHVLGQDAFTNPVTFREEMGVVLDEVGISECLTARQVGNIMAMTYKNWDRKAYAENLRRLAVPEDRRFKELSRGMKMKLGLSVALSHHARLLLLDEATSGLDPVARDEVVGMLGEFTRQEDNSILISSHIVSDLEKLCDYIAFLHKGRLLLCEEKDALLERCGVVRCSAQQIQELDPSAILGRRENPYGAEAVVLRDAVPSGLPLGPVDLEQLFILMTKEAG